MAILQHKPANPADIYPALERSIYKLAHKWARNNRQDFDDLVMEGWKGAMLAYNNYDDSKGMAFSSYAYNWARACIHDQAHRDWNNYNADSGKEIDDSVMGEDGYEMDMDQSIDYSRKLDKMTELEQSIAIARNEGYSYREISEALSELGTDLTLHQVRNMHLDAIKKVSIEA
jgi:RNA polymerase sigma factor (sigma-70 family)